MSEEQNTIIYRLGKMEELISDLANKIDSLSEKIGDAKVSEVKIKNEIDNLQARVSALENAMPQLHKDYLELKEAPDKAAADKWRYIADYIFKGLVAFAVGYIFIKAGLK